MNSKDILIYQLQWKNMKYCEEGKTVMFIAVNDKLRGIIAVSDTLKETSKTGVRNYIKWE